MDHRKDEPASRRTFFRVSTGGVVLATASAVFGADDDKTGREFLVRNQRPLDAETPPEVFRTWVTPNRLFFVRSHFGAPAVGLSPWKLEVAGGKKTMTLGQDDLATFERVTIPAVLQCSGNGRAFFVPRVPGVGWERGAVGNAEWGGIRLKDVLEKSGIESSHKHVHLLGADGPPNPKTPAFLRDLPIERALDPSTIVATTMNGEPLSILHGGPIRLVVPGWAGNHWIKWLRSITLSADEASGFYQKTGYRIPNRPLPPGQTPKPDDLVPVTTMNVKSLFAQPTDGHSLKTGRLELRGVAWTGEGRITQVEVAIDGEGWKLAELFGPDHRGSWRQWRLAWEATPGKHRLAVRATDSNGQVQPEKTPWNKSGYLWNGIDVVQCEVSS